MVTRSLKRCNSETDLLSVYPAKQSKNSMSGSHVTDRGAPLSKQLSAQLSGSSVVSRIRKSIRRRSSQKPDPNLSMIPERNQLNISMLENTISEIQPDGYKFGQKCPKSTPRLPRKTITRSNAFRRNLKMNQSESDTMSVKLRPLSTNVSTKMSTTSIHSVKSDVCSTRIRSDSKFLISTPVLDSRRRNSFNRFCSQKSQLESRKKVKSIANFNLSLSIALWLLSIKSIRIIGIIMFFNSENMNYYSTSETPFYLKMPMKIITIPNCTKIYFCLTAKSVPFLGNCFN